MTLQKLLERIEAATGPDREIDDTIWHWMNRSKLNPAAPGWQYDLIEAPNFTASMDAALAAVGHALSGWHWTVASPFLDKDGMFYAALADQEDNGAVEPWNVEHETHEARAKSAPLAILAALLRALIAKETP